jgi:hypothetical protein
LGWAGARASGDTASRRRLRPDLDPLRSSRDFRLVFVSLTVTGFGTLAVEVALLVQVKQLTHQSIPDAMRGRLAGVELLSYGVGPPAPG